MGLFNEVKGNTDYADDFVCIGDDLFDSEDMTDAAYSAFVDMIATGFSAKKDGMEHISDLGRLYRNGAYLPCVKRFVYGDTTDVVAMDADRPYFYIPAGDGTNSTFLTIRPLDKFPRGVACLARGDKYKLIIVDAGNGSISSMADYFVIKKNGDICPTSVPSPAMVANASKNRMHTAANASTVIGAWDDAQHLWSAAVSEEALSQKTPLTLGLGAEEVKSIFYARSLPVTESGRKRPIIHLVNAHKRRIKDGIDIDVAKHIRGVDTVSMHGMDFTIRPPQKESELWSRWENAKKEES